MKNLHDIEFKLNRAHVTSNKNDYGRQWLDNTELSNYNGKTLKDIQKKKNNLYVTLKFQYKNI